MTWDLLVPLLITGAGTGLTCGLSCGACGNPVVNVFLASYLFTHAGRIWQSVKAFLGFHLGKTVSVMILCGVFALLGGSAAEEMDTLFGIRLQTAVYAAMLLFVAGLIVQWIRKPGNTQTCSGGCSGKAPQSGRFVHMFCCGLISGLSPCASLLLLLGYAVSLTAAQAVLVGMCFSLANSIIPLLLLVLLTGLLSREMFQEIPGKVRYFQLATYVLFASALLYQLLK